MSIGKILSVLSESKIICTTAQTDGRIAFRIDGKLWWYYLDGALAVRLYDIAKRNPGKALNIAKNKADELIRPGSEKWEKNPDKK